MTSLHKLYIFANNVTLATNSSPRPLFVVCPAGPFHIVSPLLLVFPASSQLDQSVPVTPPSPGFSGMQVLDLGCCPCWVSLLFVSVLQKTAKFAFLLPECAHISTTSQHICVSGHCVSFPQAGGGDHCRGLTPKPPLPSLSNRNSLNAASWTRIFSSFQPDT